MYSSRAPDEVYGEACRYDEYTSLYSDWVSSAAIRKETEEIPSWVEKLHLEGIYSWFKKEQKIKNTIVGSVFKKKVLNEASEEEAEQKPEDSSEENILDVQEENVNTLEKRRQC